MAAAAVAFERCLAAVELHPARMAVVCNFTGAASRSTAVLAAALAGQIASTVLWDNCMDCLAERQIQCALEVGPGAALSAMWRERHPEIPVRSIDEFQSPAVGAYFDVGNVVEYGFPEEWIHELGHRILKIHIKEYAKPKRFDYPLGEGEIDWSAVRQALIDVGYEGWITAEALGAVEREVG